MSVFECNVKVGLIGYFVVGEGRDGVKKYGDHFLPLDISDEVKLTAEDRGYEIQNAYVNDTCEEYIA